MTPHLADPEGRQGEVCPRTYPHYTQTVLLIVVVLVVPCGVSETLVVRVSTSSVLRQVWCFLFVGDEIPWVPLQ